MRSTRSSHKFRTRRPIFESIPADAKTATRKKVFEIDPNDATAHEWFAQVIGEIGGREQEALAEGNRAHQLEPLLPVTSYTVGRIHIAARRYDDAIVVCKKLVNENPTFAKAHYCLFRAYWGKRMYPQVIKEWRTYSEHSGDRNESEYLRMVLWHPLFVNIKSMSVC